MNTEKMLFNVYKAMNNGIHFIYKNFKNKSKNSILFIKGRINSANNNNKIYQDNGILKAEAAPFMTIFYLGTYDPSTGVLEFIDVTKETYYNFFYKNLCEIVTNLNIKKAIREEEHKKLIHDRMAKSFTDTLESLREFARAKREKEIAITSTFTYKFKNFLSKILSCPLVPQIKPLKKPPKMKDRIQKIIRDCCTGMLSKSERKNYFSALKKKAEYLKKADHLRRKSLEYLKKYDPNDDDDDKNFLKFLRNLVERFEDVIYSIMDNKIAFLSLVALIGTSLYLYKNRKVVGRKLSDIKQEIEKKFADFEKNLDKYK